MNTKRVKHTFCMVVLSGLIVCGFAHAQARTVIFPYANTSQTTTAASGSPWGRYGNYMMWKLDGSGNVTSTPNYIWNNSNVFYNVGGVIGGYMNTAGKSSSDESQMRWCVEIFNPNDFDFSGASRLKLYLHNNDGSLIDETTTWNGSNLLINTAGGANLQWDSAGNFFYVTVPAQSTVVINNAWEVSNKLYNNPPPYTQLGYQAWIRLVKEDGAYFAADFHGICSSHWRISAGSSTSSFSPEWQCWQYSYDGIDLDTIEDKVTLSDLEEFSDGTSTTAIESGNVICLVNAGTTATGYVIRSTTPNGSFSMGKSMNPWQRYTFAPSQFAASAADNKYSIKIIGLRPVAVAFSLKFTKSNYTINSNYTRLSATSICEPFYP